MKIYELSEKINISQNEIIKVLKSLVKKQSNDLDYSTTLSEKELGLLEKHFGVKTEAKKKESEAKKGKTEVLIINKPKREEQGEKKANPEKKTVKVVKKRPVKKVAVKKAHDPNKVSAEDKSEKRPNAKPEDKKSTGDNRRPSSNDGQRRPHRDGDRGSDNRQDRPNRDNRGGDNRGGDNRGGRDNDRRGDRRGGDNRGNDNRGNDRRQGGNDRGNRKGGGSGSINFGGGTPPKPDDIPTKGPARNPNKGGKNPKKGAPREKEVIEKDIYIKKPVNKDDVNLDAVPKSIDIMETITVSDLAKKLNIKAKTIIAKLFKLGMMATINEAIDADTATLVAEEYKCEVKVVSLYDETVIEEVKDKEEDLQSRPPIVTVMGHVDHGKTKLLDTIRQANVIAGESGGITQHIGAYQVTTESGKLTFLDTPGHQAFTAMRARGAKVTDIVILVVAADDGVMPQTVEAINHAKAAEVPIVVAINKMDSDNANPDRVKQQLSEHDLLPEDWGGSIAMIGVSALKNENIDDLLERVVLESEVLELKANPNRMAQGTIIESKVDIGRGPVATLLVENGTLKVGDPFVAGVYAGKVRALFNDQGVSVSEAPPAMPVEVLGIEKVPEAGDPFDVVKDEKEANQIADKRKELKKHSGDRDAKSLTSGGEVDWTRLMKQTQELKIVLKGDVQGSVEALKDSFHKLVHDEVTVKVIHAQTGAINENDIHLASSSNALIIGFHVHPNGKAAELAHEQNVEIRKFSIIYDAINTVKAAMEGMLSPDLHEEVIGDVEVRELFKVPKIGVIAGSFVTNGYITRNCQVRVIRDGIEVYEGKLMSLRRFKDDVSEVKENFECGIGIENYQDLKVGDIIQGFIIKEIAKTLD